MSQQAFHNKWSQIHKESPVQADEKSLYTELGNEPVTQRQLNLYYYFLFIQKHVSRVNAKNVIELGCGRGTISLFLAQYLGMNLTLMDNEEDAVNISRDAFEAHGLHAEFITGDALDTKLPDESFDVAVSIGLAEHLDNVDDLFAEQFRIIRPGGLMITLNIPKKFSIQYLNTIHRTIKKLVGSYKESVRKDYYRNTLKPKDYKKAAEHSGFKDISITHVCPFPIYVPITMKTDKRLANARKIILKVRRIFQKYPYKTNRIVAQAHFLVAKKPR
ncbi:MAG: methyltransferase domain-containing protein [Candidatus Peribacteraceae bacterium]|nr:methyltransferase domain-containing protein [Candidatus Peribacteraceae bacterium]